MNQPDETAPAEWNATRKQKALKLPLWRLVDSKNVVDFTASQLDTWTAALSIYPTEVASRALIEFAIGVDPFPDLGKVLLRAQRINHKAKGHATAPPTTLGSVALESVAKEWGVELESE